MQVSVVIIDPTSSHLFLILQISDQMKMTLIVHTVSCWSAPVIGNNGVIQCNIFDASFV